MLLHIMQCTRQPPTTMSHQAPNVSSAKVEKPTFRECSRSVGLGDLHILHEDNILRGRVKQKISKAFSC